MVSIEILLRPKYLLSFFTTTLLMALTSQPSLAFSITPLPPLGATNWDPDESYTLANGRRGTTTLNPTVVRNLTRGGTTGFLSTLRQNFPTWTFSVASNALSGNFDIVTYDAVGTTQSVGADFVLRYTPRGADPYPQQSRLNWIQRVVTNHNIRGGGSHGPNTVFIDNGGTRNHPFYNDPSPFTSQQEVFFYETYFGDTPRRPDPAENHNWLAELYLVDQIAPRHVIIHNGIQWGWSNRVEPVPEPLTMLGAAAALGYGAILKRKYSKNTES